MISVVYVISYLSLGLPAILAGALVVDSGLARTAEELGIGVIVLATLTAIGLARSLRQETRARRRDAGTRASGLGAGAREVCTAVR